MLKGLSLINVYPMACIRNSHHLTGGKSSPDLRLMGWENVV